MNFSFEMVMGALFLRKTLIHVRSDEECGRMRGRVVWINVRATISLRLIKGESGGRPLCGGRFVYSACRMQSKADLMVTNKSPSQRNSAGEGRLLGDENCEDKGREMSDDVDRFSPASSSSISQLLRASDEGDGDVGGELLRASDEDDGDVGGQLLRASDEGDGDLDSEYERD